VEVERFRESRTLGKFPVSPGRDSESRDITREPLVMASEVAGLDPLHGYFKHGNLVLRMRFPYLELAAKVEKFIERKAVATATPAPVAVQPPQATAVEPVPPKKLPLAVEVKPPVQVEQQHFFE
jgi:hypothetical protein